MEPTVRTASNMIMPEPAHHEHAYRQIIIVVIVLLGLVVLGGLVYNYVANKRATERAMRAQYQTEQVMQAQSFYDVTTKSSGKPVTAADLKATEEFFKANNENVVTSDPAQGKAQYQQVFDMSEANYQEWKAAQAK